MSGLVRRTWQETGPADLLSLPNNQAGLIQELQDQSLNHALGGDALGPFSAVARECRRSTARARRRFQSRDSALLVAQILSHACLRDTNATHRGQEIKQGRWNLDESFVTIARFEIPQESNSKAWSARGDSDRQAAVRRCRAERAWSRRSAGDRSLAEQKSRALAFTVPATRAGDASVPVHARTSEVRRRSY